VNENEHENDNEAEFDAAFDEDEATEIADDTDEAVSDEEAEPENQEVTEDDEEAGDAQEGEQQPDSTDQEEENQDDNDADDDIPAEDMARYKSWEGRLRKREQEIHEREAKLKQLESEQNDGEEEEDPQDDQDEQDEDAVARLREDYPDIFAAMEQEINRRLSGKDLGQVIEQVEAFTQAEQDRQIKAHRDAIKAKHPDFDNIETDALNSWVEQQPYKDAVRYQSIIESGTADEVIEMLDQYKGTVLKEQERQQFQKRREQQKNAGKSVPNHSSRVTNTIGNADPDDFDAGWDEADD